MLRVDDHRRAPGHGRSDLEVVAQAVEEQAFVEALEEGLVARVGKILPDRRQPEPPVVMAEGEGLGDRGDGPVAERGVGHDRLVERGQRHEASVGGRRDGDIDRGMEIHVAGEGGRGQYVADKQPGGRPAPAVMLVAVEGETRRRRAHGLEAATQGPPPRARQRRPRYRRGGARWCRRGRARP